MRHPLSVLLLCVAALVASCTDFAARECTNGTICPPGTVCSETGGCVVREQAELCAGQPDGTACSYADVPNGVCAVNLCVPVGCGNNVVEEGEVCDDGNNLPQDGCSADCRSEEICGNGIIDGLVGEACDDGNNLDGDGCQANCASPTCGDGVVDPQFNEVCDDGSANSDAANASCRTNCQPRRCGDGVEDDGELCDDGNVSSADGCSFDCQSEESCGNGYLDSSVGEACDDGNNVDGDGCQANCASPNCGDGIVDPQFNEACDEGANNSDSVDASCRTNCQPRRCGDGVADTGEFCDDGNVVSADGCSADCQSNETCGNGILDATVGESCDDGNNIDGDGCQGDCATPNCGDGIIDPQFNEICDDGTANSNAADASCRTNCQPRRCGDQIVDFAAGETCDDGNLFPGDGCTGGCLEEFCGNGVIDLELVNGSFLPSEECDDGENGLNHDGCAQSCTLEALDWHDTANPVAPSPRKNHAIAYDAARQRVVLFGGSVATGRVGDTWEWDGAHWTEVSPATSAPAPREDHVMAYDAARERVVLFGGYDGTSVLADTWEWDGATWTEVVPVTAAPTPRLLHAMAYDSARERMVLFGGSGGGRLGDTWEWDGADWTEVSPATSGPAARERHAMAYDSARGRIVLVGGMDATGRVGDTWEWDGATWTEITPATSAPAPRNDHGMAYDPARGRVVLFGGFDGTGTAGDTWEWDGADWTEVSPAATPPPRVDHAMAYDAARGRIVLFGGLATANFQTALADDTWTWNGVDWIEVTPPTAPAPRSNHAMAYDTARGRIVLFGGLENTGLNFGDTWEWNGVDWTEVTPATSSPQPRMRHAMVYDTARGRIVLFGGIDNTSNNLIGDTWEWDGATWTEITPATATPTPRQHHAMAYDAARGRVVLFGGIDTSNNFVGDTWEWDGATWTEITPATTAPPRLVEHAMAYDAIRGRVVLMGGNDGQNSDFENWEWDGADWTEIIPTTSGPTTRRIRHATAYDPAGGRVVLFGGFEPPNFILGDHWEWNGVGWTEVSLTSAPPARQNHAMAYDAARGRVVLFGGRNSGGMSDTWTSRYDAGISELCLSDLDRDGDGLMGCADPDCWGRCTPNCPPNSTPNWPADCSTAEPHCGDGVCNTFLETPRLCPGDCGLPPPVCGDFICEGSETLANCPGDCRP